jgi:hypothetical protein
VGRRSKTKKNQLEGKEGRSGDKSLERTTLGGITSLNGGRMIEYLSTFKA